MDKQTLAVLLIFSIPVLVVLFNGLTKLARIKAEAQRSGGGEAMERLSDLEAQVNVLQRQLSETQERLDFAERLLAKPRDKASS